MHRCRRQWLSHKKYVFGTKIRCTGVANADFEPKSDAQVSQPVILEFVFTILDHNPMHRGRKWWFVSVCLCLFFVAGWVSRSVVLRWIKSVLVFMSSYFSMYSYYLVCAPVGFLGLRVVGLGLSGNLMRVLFLFVVACWVLGSWLLVFSHCL